MLDILGFHPANFGNSTVRFTSPRLDVIAMFFANFRHEVVPLEGRTSVERANFQGCSTKLFAYHNGFSLSRKCAGLVVDLESANTMVENTNQVKHSDEV